MKMGKRFLAILLALSLVAVAGSVMMVSAEETPGASYANDFYDGSLFKTIAENNDEAIVEVNNLDQAAIWVEYRGNKGALFAGVLETDPDDPMNKLKTVSPENQHDGYILYKLNVAEGTKNLNVGLFYYVADGFTGKVKVYVSKDTTFGATPDAEFGAGVDNYLVETKQVDISALNSTTVYVKVVVPYANVREDGGNRAVDLGIEAIFVTPEVTKALHTTDTNPDNAGATGTPIVDANFVEAMHDGSRDPWSIGLYGFSPKDTATQMTPPMFRSDENGVLPSEGGPDYDPKYVEFFYKVNTVSAMEGAKITVTGSVEADNANNDYPFLAISYSRDGVAWTEGVRKSGDEIASRWTGDLELELDSDKIGDGVDTLYVKVTFYKVSWPNWAYIKGVKIETTGANPTVQDDPESSDPESSDPESSDPESSDPESSDPESSDPESSDPESSDPESSDPESSDPGEDSPVTGDVFSITAILALAASASGVVLTKKRK